SAFTVRDYHDFEHLYIETRLEEEVKISACGIMRAEFCKEFYQSAKIYGKKGGILNIGTYLGRSAIAFALGSKAVGGRKIIAVDPVLPTEFYDNVKKNGVSDYIIPFEMPSEELYNSWPKLMKERQELELGLVFVDGAHGYGQASFDISRWEEYLVSGGLMLIDDYERAEPDVLRAVYEYVVCSGKFKSISMPIDRLVKAEKR
ncbi:MAG: class I SAM-dependent methyltransferase, partial [Candidatus Omnitrophica bacterium]|nr:class I SAM-dependent methyltransferase [Candidatus Omnitrophota bacterium]